MAWFGRLPCVRGSDLFCGLMSRMCYKHFGTECSWLVSSFGRCRNASGRLTCGTLHPTGYRVVMINNYRFLLHRLVAFTFLGPPQEASAWYVHHRDGDAVNNRLGNLAYVTHAQNVRSSFDNNKERGCSSRVLSVPVMWRDLSQTKVWSKSASIKAAARDLCICPKRISLHCQNRTAIGGYEVKFAPPKEPNFLPGEEWMPMKNPLTGTEVPRRQVSSLGRIKSARGLITRGWRTPSGYLKTEVNEENKRYVASIHRLVVYAFFGPPPSRQHSHVNHKDLNPSNNCVDNLEYVTPSENVKHFYENRGFQLPNSCKQKPVLGRPRGGSEEEWVWYKSMNDAAEVLGVSRQSVSQCARGVCKHSGAYEFRLAESAEPLQLPGEEWRPVDLEGLLRERAKRMKWTRLNHCSRWFVYLGCLHISGPSRRQSHQKVRSPGTEPLQHLRWKSRVTPVPLRSISMRVEVLPVWPQVQL